MQRVRDSGQHRGIISIGGRSRLPAPFAHPASFPLYCVLCTLYSFVFHSVLSTQHSVLLLELPLIHHQNPRRFGNPPETPKISGLFTAVFLDTFLSFPLLDCVFALRFSLVFYSALCTLYSELLLRNVNLNPLIRLALGEAFIDRWSWCP